MCPLIYVQLNPPCSHAVSQAAHNKQRSPPDAIPFCFVFGKSPLACNASVSCSDHVSHKCISICTLKSRPSTFEQTLERDHLPQSCVHQGEISLLTVFIESSYHWGAILALPLSPFCGETCRFCCRSRPDPVFKEDCPSCACCPISETCCCPSPLPCPCLALCLCSFAR